MRIRPYPDPHHCVDLYLFMPLLHLFIPGTFVEHGGGGRDRLHGPGDQQRPAQVLHQLRRRHPDRRCQQGNDGV